MSDITLRGYQECQLEFLKNNKNKVKGIESATGTGKTYVILDFIKYLINRENNEYKTIVFTTGFNQLIFQMKEDIENHYPELNYQILIGSGLLSENCITKNDDIEFKKDYASTCPLCKFMVWNKTTLKLEDRRPSNCSKKLITEYLRDNTNTKFIITNHSYYLAMKDFIKADLVIIDEAHTFGNFYSSFNTITLDKNEQNILNNYVRNFKTPTSAILNMAILNGLNINESLTNNICDELVNKYPKTVYSEVKQTCDKLNKILTNKAFDNFIENNNGTLSKNLFFNKFDLSSKDYFTKECKYPDIILFSATIDDYTKRMFGISNSKQIYVQAVDRKRYVGSDYISVHANYNDKLQDVLDNYILNNKTNKEGLILCTSNDSVTWTQNFLRDNYKDKVDVFTNPISMRESNTDKVKIMIGSKQYFQGLDIPTLNFTILDKIPFEVYDAKFQAYSYYLSKTTKCDPWTDYTIPLLKNSIIQALGRTWRKNDIENRDYDQGTVVIFDERLGKRFSYIDDWFVMNKPGINKVIVE